MKKFISIRNNTDWTQCFYQYANRLAHLYLLRKLNGIDAALVFVYFVNDQTTYPVSREGWEAAIGLATNHLGVRPHSPFIRDNVADVFIDVEELSSVAWP